MKTFAIKNEYEQNEPVAFLIYYETVKKFYIEITENADEWTVPFFLSAFVKKGVFTINSRFSYDWVKQRIVPTDRQNIGQILRDNNLKSYNEFELLLQGNGRCAQDDYYLEEISESSLPLCILNRLKKRIDDVIPLSASFSLLVFFNEGVVKMCELKKIIESNYALNNYLSQFPERIKNVKVDVGGYGVSWGENLTISDVELYHSGEILSISKDDFKDFISERVVNTAEAAEIIGCSRQNIDDLIKRGKLSPVKVTAKDKLFLKSDILKREWN